MRVTIVFEYARRSLTCATGQWASRIARGLASRGHSVTIACDGLAEPSMFAGATLEVRRPGRRLKDRDGRGVQGWLSESRTLMDADVVLSLSRLWPGDVWAPVGAPARDEISAIVRMWRRPATLAFEAAQQRSLLGVAMAERAARLRPDGPAPICATIGPGGQHTADKHESLGYASHLPDPELTDPAAVGSRVRQMLGVPPHATLLVASCLHHSASSLAEIAGGVRLASRDLDAYLVLAGYRPHSASGVVARAGAESRVRLVGPTRRMDALLAGADAAAIYVPSRHAGETGRFVADALHYGRPVLALAEGTGASLIERARGRIGRIVRTNEEGARAWAEAISGLADPDVRTLWAGEASSIAPAMAMDRLLDRLEVLLERGAASRARR